MTRPPPCRDHDPKRLAPDQEGAAQIDADQPVEVRRRGLEQRLLDQDAGVVDQDVEAAETGDAVSNMRQHLALVGDVGLHGEGPAPLRLRSRRPPLRSSPAARGPTTATCAPSAANASGDRPPDAARAAGDQSALALQRAASGHHLAAVDAVGLPGDARCVLGGEEQIEPATSSGSIRPGRAWAARMSPSIASSLAPARAETFSASVARRAS